MPQFRKKPVVIEAVQMTSGADVPQWLQDALMDGRAGYTLAGGLSILTLEGTMIAGPGDWVIQGVKGEIYPCKPDIFAATYEPAEPPAIVAEFTPEQLEAAQREWEKPTPITWLPEAHRQSKEFFDLMGGVSPEMRGVDPGPALGIPLQHCHICEAMVSHPCTSETSEGCSLLGERLTGIDADEGFAEIYARISDDLGRIMSMAVLLEAQLQAEGDHTAAANAEIERLQETVAALAKGD